MLRDLLQSFGICDYRGLLSKHDIIEQDIRKSKLEGTLGHDLKLLSIGAISASLKSCSADYGF